MIDHSRRWSASQQESFVLFDVLIIILNIIDFLNLLYLFSCKHFQDTEYFDEITATFFDHFAILLLLVKCINDPKLFQYHPAAFKLIVDSAIKQQNSFLIR